MLVMLILSLFRHIPVMVSVIILLLTLGAVHSRKTKFEKSHRRFIDPDDIPVDTTQYVNKTFTFGYIKHIVGGPATLEKTKGYEGLELIMKRLFNHCDRALKHCQPKLMNDSDINGKLNMTNIYNYYGFTKNVPCGAITIIRNKIHPGFFTKLININTPHDPKWFSVITKQVTPDQLAHLNITIHLLQTREYTTYTNVNYKERDSCTYSFVLFKTLNQDKVFCGYIVNKTIIMNAYIVAIIIVPKRVEVYTNYTFALIMSYQVMNIRLHTNVLDYIIRDPGFYTYILAERKVGNYAAKPFNDYMYLYIIRLDAFVGQSINLILRKNINCISTVDAVKIFDGPITIWNNYLCANKSDDASAIDNQEFLAINTTFRAKVTYWTSQYIVKGHTNAYLSLVYNMVNMTSMYINLSADVNMVNFSIDSTQQSILYQKWAFLSLSDQFIQLEASTVKVFHGLIFGCHYGGVAVNDYDADPRKQVGPFCTTDGHEPLIGEMKSWYFGDAGGEFIVYSFQEFFSIHIDLIVRQQECEGLTNVCDYSCRYVCSICTCTCIIIYTYQQFYEYILYF